MEKDTLIIMGQCGMIVVTVLFFGLASLLKRINRNGGYRHQPPPEGRKHEMSTSKGRDNHPQR